MAKEGVHIMTLGQRIARLRRERGWTQDQLSEKVGVHSRHISRWETDRNRPSARTLERLAEIFEVSWDDLVRTSDQQPPEMLLEDDLLQQFRELRELEEEDRNTIRNVIQAFLTKKRMEKVLRH
jgi:transcriptional regulator with XRE-family HTH domain